MERRKKIEVRFKFDPVFEYFMGMGGRSKCLSALVHIKLEEAERISLINNIPFENREDLLGNEVFLKIVEERGAKKQTARTIRNDQKVPDYQGSFSQEGGEQTAAMKLKRNVAREKYESFIEEMYGKGDLRKKAS